MRIICGISARNNSILHITDTLRHLGHEAVLVNTEDFQDACPYAWKKLDELGFHYKRNQYVGERRRKIFSLLDSFRPDCILFINIAKPILSLQEMRLKETLINSLLPLPSLFLSCCVRCRST